MPRVMSRRGIAGEYETVENASREDSQRFWTADATLPGVLRLDAALHPIEIAILKVQETLLRERTDEPHFSVHQRCHSK